MKLEVGKPISYIDFTNLVEISVYDIKNQKYLSDVIWANDKSNEYEAYIRDGEGHYVCGSDGKILKRIHNTPIEFHFTRSRLETEIVNESNQTFKPSK